MNRKHADVIRAWLDGAEVEYYSEVAEKWMRIEEPGFSSQIDYRVASQFEVGQFLLLKKGDRLYGAFFDCPEARYVRVTKIEFSASAGYDYWVSDGTHCQRVHESDVLPVTG